MYSICSARLLHSAIAQRYAGSHLGKSIEEHIPLVVIGLQLRMHPGNRIGTCASVS